jgi:hypothetical protein
MTKRLWFIDGNISLPPVEISRQEMVFLKVPKEDGPAVASHAAYPVYWSDGMGVWPEFYGAGQIVREIAPEEI